MLTLSLFVVPLGANRVHALSGLPLGDPNNTWTPYGPDPSLRNLLIKYYSGDSAEYSDFKVGGLDVADSGTAGTGPPRSQWPIYDANVDWNMSAAQGSGVWHGIYFNGASSNWAKWGCDWQGYNSACGIEMRQAFSHLVDRAAFAASHLGSGGGVPVWDDIPANKALASPPNPPNTLIQSPSSNFCTWDTVSNVGCSQSTGPYHLGSGGVTGFAQIGSADFCAAAQHMINAGIATGKDSNCVLTGVNSGVFSNPLRAKIRSSEPRKSLGEGFQAAMNALFGANVATIQEGGIGVIGIPIVFSEPPTSPVDDWDYYTYGYQDTGPFPTYLYTQFSTKFAFPSTGVGGIPQCTGGAVNNDFPTNPTFTCIPALDTALFNAVQTGSETTFDSLILTASNVAGSHVASIPVYTLNVRTPALRTVSGLINTRGVGYESVGIFTTVHKNAYVPSDGRFQFNNGGTSDTIRWGAAQPIDFLNLFQSGTVWEFNTAFNVYDTLLTASPIETQKIYCEMCRTYSILSTSPNTVIDVTLRDGMHWQDGVPIDAKDIKFSFDNLRDFASVLSGNLALLCSPATCGAAGSTNGVTLDPNNPLHFTITMQGASVGHLPNISGVAILPRHLWECPASGVSIDGVTPCAPAGAAGSYGEVGQVDQFKAGTGYDPVSAGTFIGSGLFECKSVFASDLGKVGTGCTRNSDGSRGGQGIGIGGTALFTAFDNTGTPGATSFDQWTRLNNPKWGAGGSAVSAASGENQLFYWADESGDGIVDITDINHIASCIGAASASAACPDYGYWAYGANNLQSPSSPTISIQLYNLVFSLRFSGQDAPLHGQLAQVFSRPIPQVQTGSCVLPMTAVHGTSITIDCTAALANTRYPANSAIVVNWGDGTATQWAGPEFGSSAIVTHTYSAAGAPTATLDIHDQNGNPVDKQATQVITVS